MKVAVAASNSAAANAAVVVAGDGGNAVDAAVAATLVTCVSEPGIVSLAGGAFVTIAPANAEAITVDGYVEMPGRGLPPNAFGRGTLELMTGYGGGTAMTIGHGSVATPGLLSGLQVAHRLHGRLPWAQIVQPAIEVARAGFPLGKAGDHYFTHVRDSVFGHDPATRAALHHPDGAPIRAGENLRIADLAQFLELVADQGADALMRGPIAAALVEQMSLHGGLITMADLAAYEPVVRPAITVELGPPGRAWTLATNPPPAIGGPVLVAMLILLHEVARSGWHEPDFAVLVEVMRSVLMHRSLELDLAQDRLAAGQALLDGVRSGGQAWLGVAPSTAHISTVDAHGTACAITASCGYGSGITVPGTGVWLNNCLGEHELNRRGTHALFPGTRLASNMVPTVGRCQDGAVIAIGSPGADRITTALAQVLVSLANADLSLQEAIDRARVHLDRNEQGQERLHYEADLPSRFLAALPADASLASTEHEACSMYFGGVGAAVLTADGSLSAAADPRRAGVVRLS